MFRRILFENWVGIFTLIAFITSASIYVSFAWRAFRMTPPDLERLSQLPFGKITETPKDRHEV